MPLWLLHTRSTSTSLICKCQHAMCNRRDVGHPEASHVCPTITEVVTWRLSHLSSSEGGGGSRQHSIRALTLDLAPLNRVNGVGSSFADCTSLMRIYLSGWSAVSNEARRIASS